MINRVGYGFQNLFFFMKIVDFVTTPSRMENK